MGSRVTQAMDGEVDAPPMPDGPDMPDGGADGGEFLHQMIQVMK